MEIGIVAYLEPWMSWKGLGILFLGAIAVTLGSGQVIKKAMSSWSEDEELKGGLENAGKVIGNLERLLVFIFLLSGLYAGVGFLIAAKSILRFSSTREDRKMAEYVLIGTLWSFTLAVVVSLLTLLALHLA